MYYKILLKIKTLTLFGLLVTSNLFAQLIQNKSIEINYIDGANSPEFKILPIKEGGFILQEQIENTLSREDEIWYIKKYNNNMDLDWSINVEVPYEYNFGDDFLNKNSLFQYFTTRNSTKIRLLKIDIEKGYSEWIEGDLIGIQDIYQMKVVENMAFFYGKFQGRPVVLAFSLFDKTIKALNGLYSNHTEVVEMDVDETNGELNVYYKNRYKRKCQLQLNSYSQEGTYLATTLIENDTKKMPFNGKLKKLKDNEELLIGTYARLCDNFSQGIYVKKLNNGITTKSKFIDFSEFKNFFKYLNPKRQKRVEDKLSKRKEAGKDIKFNYSMLVHKIYNFNDQFVMVAEIYYTETRQPGSLPYFNYENFTPYIYKFTHTIVCGFDTEGNKLWDNCVPMKALKSNYLNEQVQLTQVGNKLILAYPEDGKIKTQVIEEDKTIKEKEVFEVIAKKGNFGDENEGGLSAWYDQNYLYWGYKTINNEGGENGKKTFFINKLTYKL
jgi:hypothetical protein